MFIASVVWSHFILVVEGCNIGTITLVLTFEQHFKGTSKRFAQFLFFLSPQSDQKSRQRSQGH
jgi:hypothetical protein